MNNNISFSPDDLYELLTDRIISFLNGDNSTLDEENRSVLLEHINRKLGNKKSQLPSLGKEYQWLNTMRPLCLGDDLGKKICVIDFFTYCCINCIHILPYLKEVETIYATNPVVAVIGIHCPKFSNEMDLDKVRDAIIRNDICHPVLNDPNCILWKTFKIECWPTVFIVGPDRVLLFELIGEKQIEKLPFLCDLVFNYVESSSFELDPSVLPIYPLKEKLEFSELLYPGNVSSNGVDILVSDTGHNRLILLSCYLKVKAIIGSGVMGSNDGSFETASFNSPHGTAWFVHDVWYVADTGNHSIRKVCFEDRTVSTLYDGRNIRMDIDNVGANMKFRSPWDVCIGKHIGTSLYERNVLYIAVAGSHQIWTYDFDAPKSCESCLPFAGCGREENRPNYYKHKSGFAQPSGVAYNPNFMPDYLFVADSESSTIKKISLILGSVSNIVGGGLDPKDLFQFGDKDGKYREVRLQHPMSICVVDKNNLIIADTYNHKIKLVNVSKQTCQTMETGKDLNEPSGICTFQDSLVIADTNNHRIVTIPLNEILSATIPEKYNVEVVSQNLSVEDDPQTVLSISNVGKVYCHFIISSIKKYVLNEHASQKLDISFEGNKLDVVYRREKLFGDIQPSLVLSPISMDKFCKLLDPSEVILILSIPLCDKQTNTCCYRKVIFKLKINTTSAGAEHVNLKLNLSDELKLSE